MPPVEGRKGDAGGPHAPVHSRSAQVAVALHRPDNPASMVRGAQGTNNGLLAGAIALAAAIRGLGATPGAVGRFYDR